MNSYVVVRLTLSWRELKGRGFGMVKEPKQPGGMPKKRGLVDYWIFGSVT